MRPKKGRGIGLLGGSFGRLNRFYCLQVVAIWLWAEWLSATCEIPTCSIWIPDVLQGKNFSIYATCLLTKAQDLADPFFRPFLPYPSTSSAANWGLLFGTPKVWKTCFTSTVSMQAHKSDCDAAVWMSTSGDHQNLDPECCSICILEVKKTFSFPPGA